MVMNTRMVEGTPVREHVLQMMGYLNVLEVLGASIDLETRVDMIPNYLPPSFNQFKLNYSMNNLSYSLSELMNSLQTANGVIKNDHSVLNLEKCSSSKLKPRGKNLKNKKKQGSSGKAGPNSSVGKGQR